MLLGWAIDVELIEKKIQDFIAGGGRVRGIAGLLSLCLLNEAKAVINPGNPTGTVLTREVIDAVVRPRLLLVSYPKACLSGRLCAKYKAGGPRCASLLAQIVILADEVYQETRSKTSSETFRLIISDNIYRIHI